MEIQEMLETACDDPSRLDIKPLPNHTANIRRSGEERLLEKINLMHSVGYCAYIITVATTFLVWQLQNTNRDV